MMREQYEVPISLTSLVVFIAGPCWHLQVFRQAHRSLAWAHPSPIVCRLVSGKLS